MQRNRSASPARRASFVIIAFVLLLSLFYAERVPPARAEELPPKTPPPGMEDLVVAYAGATPDAYEPDNLVQDLEAGLIAGNDQLLASGVTQTHSISPAGDVDYVKFHLDQASSITLATGGVNVLDDTAMWLYDSSLRKLDYNDDRSPTNWHSYIQRCGPTALPAGDYYALIGKRGNDAEIESYGVTVKINPAGPSNCIPNTTVVINGAARGSYWVHQETTTRPTPYANLNAGPVRVRALDNVKPLVASMGVSLKKTAGYESYSEFIGVPGGKLANTYWFPWYSNVGSYVSQLCFGNVGSKATTVRVTIGTRAPVAYGLGLNRAKCVSYASLDAGPVKVDSTTSLIVASLNTRLRNNASFTSYDEFGGLSASDSYSTDYMFPFYANLTAGTTVSQMRLANIGSSSAVVTLTVQGVARAKYTLLPKQGKLVSLANVNNGPVHVTSNAQPITASMIVKLKSTAPYTGYSEFLGLPETTLNQTRFVFPWYNNSKDLFSQLRVTNIGTARTDVTVTIGGITRGKVSLLPRQSRLVSYSGLNNGPVVLQSSNKIPIVASMVTFLKKGMGYTSYSEFAGQAGLPGNQLLQNAWFPWYGNATAGGTVSQLRIALPAKP
jgi:hypothetical protein